MDKFVEKARQSEIRKMSDVQLQLKLVQAGMTLEALDSMDRLAILDKYAELVLAGKEPIAGKVTGVPASVVVYDVDLLKQRLEFKVRQWEAEKAEREEQINVELARQWAEKAEREEKREIELARIEAKKSRKGETKKSGIITFRG